MRSLAACALLLAGCNLVAPVGETDSSVDGDSGAGEDGAEEEATEDGDVASTCPEGRGGPMTFVISDIVALTERVADLDGDGDLDNCVADLGDPGQTLMATAMTALVAAALDRDVRVLFHVPWVDDLSGPTDAETTTIVFEGEDTEPWDQRTPEDDFSGHEAFWVLCNDLTCDYLDGCGEPTLHSREGTIDDGAVDGGVGRVVFPISSNTLTLTNARASGRYEACGRSMDLTLAGAAKINDLGNPVTTLGDYTLLEALVNGGQVIGMPTVPGVGPDLDLDGDGIEQLALDEQGHIAWCVDGNDTQIPGRDCWLDERMADGFSLNARVFGVSAVFAGRPPGWDEHVQGGCDGGPPEPSTWDPQ